MSWLRLMEESMEENPAPPPAKKQGLVALVKHMWPAYLIEILVIILGISITLALEEWRSDVKEEKLAQGYLKNLNTDIQLDKRSLQLSITQTEKLLDRGNDLMAYSQSHDKLLYGRVNADIREIISRPKFISNDATFSDLKSSGNLHLLKDIQLKNLLFAYYNQTQIIHDVQDAEQLATITLTGPYFFRHFSLADTTGTEENMDAAFGSFEFTNHVLLRLSNRKELLNRYLKADSLASRLEEILEKKIE